MSQSLVQVRKTITYAGARVAIDAAVVKAAEIGAVECIAVVDASSNLLAYARIDGAAVVARDPAIGKAATAAATGAKTGDIPFEFGANLGFASHGALVNLGGGFPIEVDGVVIGAIGVGSGTTEQDVAVAQAGRDALLEAIGGTQG